MPSISLFSMANRLDGIYFPTNSIIPQSLESRSKLFRILNPKFFKNHIGTPKLEV